MTKIVCRKRGQALVPVDEDGLELFARLKDGRDVMVDVTASRNTRHHRLFFTMLRFIQLHSPNMCRVPIQKMRGILLIATGHCDTIVDTETGKVGYMPRSMSFASMDQTEFNQFFDAACAVIAHRWMPPKTTPQAVRNELILMCDGPHAVDGRVA
jgi:hypothetical protein